MISDDYVALEKSCFFPIDSSFVYVLNLAKKMFTFLAKYSEFFLLQSDDCCLSVLIVKNVLDSLINPKARKKNILSKKRFPYAIRFIINTSAISVYSVSINIC